MSRLAQRLLYAAGAVAGLTRYVHEPPPPPPYDAPLCPGCEANLDSPVLPTTGNALLCCRRCGTRTRWNFDGELPIMLARIP